MVKKGDMFYVSSLDSEIFAAGECGGGVTTILKFLLEQGIVDAVLCVKKSADIYDPVPTLISNHNDLIETAGSLHCGTLNMAKIIEKYINGANDIKIAVTVKPCDAMSIIELIKRDKINSDNVFMIGLNCGGTMSPVKTREMIEKFYKINPDDVIKEEINNAKFIIKTNETEKGIKIDELENQEYGRRSNCRRCDVNIPTMADMAFGNWGVIGSKTGKCSFVEIFTDKGAEILNKAVDSNVLAIETPSQEGIKIRTNIDKAMTKLAKQEQNIEFGEKKDNLLSILLKYSDQLSKCIKCFGCTESCPISQDKECVYENINLESLESEKLPISQMFYLKQLIYIANSCTNCGQCEEVCPMEIPLSKIIHELKLNAKDLFKYSCEYEKEISKR